MRKFILIIVFLLLSGNAYAVRPTTRITIEPLESVSFNTITVGTTFVTCTTGLYNRKVISIFNTSSSEIVFLGNSSTANTASITNTRWLYPRQSITFGLRSSENIYASCDSVSLVQIIEIR